MQWSRSYRDRQWLSKKNFRRKLIFYRATCRATRGALLVQPLHLRLAGPPPYLSHSLPSINLCIVGIPFVYSLYIVPSPHRSHWSSELIERTSFPPKNSFWGERYGASQGNPFRSAVPFWGKLTQIPKREWDSKGVYARASLKKRPSPYIPSHATR